MTRQALHFGISSGQQQSTYEDILPLWLAADEEPLIEHLWTFDHFIPIGGVDPSEPCLEGWTLLAALAARTQRVRVGMMVSGVTYRYPAILAKQAATVDQISRGRLNFGLGAAWNEVEHTAYGIPFPPASERIKRLDEACQIVRLLWTEQAPTFTGQYYQLKEAYSEPKPLQQPSPPLLIGASGRQMLRIVARHADIWGAMCNTAEEFRQKSAQLDENCRALARDPATLARMASVMINSPEPDWSALRASARAFIEAGARHLVVVLRAPYPEGIVKSLVSELFAPLKEFAPV
ncbi:TIGR03560 family F420-dependent LLM class oxidoreductase [Ktedonosporobacter rubrisoli]|uniref:TIGR03560 family F420-dependent LLM class oxidoreductase n=1 Tax=Ktedonosporobacter rubrisoli TaxID=2509675 RepID=A0A4P6JKN3_KTERU|nr:TIGR03560 family F420-dependent LLM class oxidoreductase [Ktedonosporobacter rubrisoli]QBD75729.1 TIGR03560 family F420-dependent LLM class oxidoreductase [Ktedonosporobacter rubrisoli]